jgi:hypothetical protein
MVRARLGCKWSLVQIQSPRLMEGPEVPRESGGLGAFVLGRVAVRVAELPPAPRCSHQHRSLATWPQANPVERFTHGRGDLASVQPARVGPRCDARPVTISRKRTGPPPPPPAPRRCSGSWLPEAHGQVGDEARCYLCGQLVRLVAPPPDAGRDPWLGAKAPRISPHQFEPDEVDEAGELTHGPHRCSWPSESSTW